MAGRIFFCANALKIGYSLAIVDLILDRGQQGMTGKNIVRAGVVSFRVHHFFVISSCNLRRNFATALSVVEAKSGFGKANAGCWVRKKERSFNQMNDGSCMTIQIFGAAVSRNGGALFRS